MDGLSRRNYFEVRPDGSVWRVAEAQLGNQGAWTRTHDRRVAADVGEFRRRFPDLTSHVKNYSAVQAEEEKTTADGVAAIIDRLSPEERDRLVRVLSSSGAGQAEALAGGTILPDDFPARSILVTHGFNTAEKIAAATYEQLRAVKGLGVARVRAVMLAADELLAARGEEEDVPAEDAAEDVFVEDGDLDF